MINRIYHLFAAVVLVLLVSCGQNRTKYMYKILVITGGHEYESSFFQMFDSFEEFSYDTVSQPDANRLIASGSLNDYQVLVFYDMWQDINEEEKQGLQSLLSAGTGMVFLHHALVSYQHWDEFKKIIGGRYIEKDYYPGQDIQASSYAHNIYLDIKIADKNHPVTTGLENFRLRDEGYSNIEVIPEVHPILTTEQEDCAPLIAWSHSFFNSRIVYILPGHGSDAHKDDNYRKIVRNAINWVAEPALK